MQQLGIPEEDKARRLLGSFGLEGIVHKNMIATLSGGQKARVALAAISAELPHFLLFDEPTNHLDVESIEALCDAIKNFKGGVLVVTHDARLIKEAGLNIWVAGDHNVKPFNGDLEDYKTYVRKIFEDEERRKELERMQKQSEKMELKEFAKTEDPKAAVAAKKEEKAQATKNALDSFFTKFDKKQTTTTKKPKAKAGAPEPAPEAK